MHDTVTNAISRLAYDPKQNLTNEYTHATVRIPTDEPTANSIKWKTFSKHWQKYDEYNATINTSDFKMNAVFANRNEDYKYTL